MSLDVYLEGESTEEECVCEKCGNRHTHNEPSLLYHENITHNLTKMADECGLYDCIWRPDEKGFTTAKQLTSLLETGLDKLVSNPWEYMKYESENGWGTYDGFVKFVGSYLHACKRYPDSKVSVSR
jgi:hypothetical protein